MMTVFPKNEEKTGENRAESDRKFCVSHKKEQAFFAFLPKMKNVPSFPLYYPK